MNYLMTKFDFENSFANNVYDAYKKPLMVLTDIFDNHGHSGGSANYAISYVKKYLNERKQYSNNDEIEPFKVDVNIKDLFDQLDELFSKCVYVDDKPILKLEDTDTPIEFFKLVDLLIKVLSHLPLSPLTGNDDEWIEHEDNLFQNKRMTSIFKDGKNKPARWSEGSIGISYNNDFNSIYHFTSNDLPYYLVQFPFDPESNEPIYYFVDPVNLDKRNYSENNLLSGTYDQLIDFVKIKQKEYRRNWMLGYEVDKKELRKIASKPITDRRMNALINYFEFVLTDELDSDGFDLFNLTRANTILFEGNMLYPFTDKEQFILYRMAIMYWDLPKEQRQKLFNLDYKIGKDTNYFVDVLLKNNNK